jgi:dCMP deaminase
MIEIDREKDRPTWDEYFMLMAKLAATRSTCLAFPVGAVIVKNRQVLATGYNGSPSGSIHCTAQGFCYEGLSSCDASKSLPSRAVHAEANAIAQAARHGIATDGATIYVTLEPCISCLKLIISAGIKEVFYETNFNLGDKLIVRDAFVADNLVKLNSMKVRNNVAQKASIFLTEAVSITKN